MGGETLDDALAAARRQARFIECGMISQYEKKEEERYGVKNTINIVFREIKMQGFMVMTYWQELAPKFYEEMPKWVKEGKIKVLESVTQGIEYIGEAFVDMMKGGKIGKAVVQVSDDPFRK